MRNATFVLTSHTPWIKVFLFGPITPERVERERLELKHRADQLTPAPINVPLLFVDAAGWAHGDE